MMKTKLPFSLIIMALLGLASSCVFKPMSGGSGSLELNYPVVFKDMATAAQIRVQKVAESRVNDLLQVEVAFKNITNIRINLEIRVKFRDEAGFEIDDPVGWTPFPIESSELKTFRRIATSNKAASFVIMVQLAE